MRTLVDTIITLGHTHSGELQKQNSGTNFWIEDGNNISESDIGSIYLSRWNYRLHRSKPLDCFVFIVSIN